MNSDGPSHWHWDLGSGTLALLIFFPSIQGKKSSIHSSIHARMTPSNCRTWVKVTVKRMRCVHHLVEITSLRLSAGTQGFQQKWKWLECDIASAQRNTFTHHRPSHHPSTAPCSGRSEDNPDVAAVLVPVLRSLSLLCSKHDRPVNPRDGVLSHQVSQLTKEMAN